MIRRGSPREGRRDAPADAPPGPGFALRAAALAAVTLYVTVMTLFKMSNNDIWIHLKTGAYVLTHGWVPILDPYSFIAADRAYVAHEWLAGVLFHLVFAPFGVSGLIFFKAAVIAAACALLIHTARMLGARWSVILPAFACLLYISSARYLERPHIFSYLMAAVYLWLFFRYRECGRDRRWLWGILPAHVVWTNLHGGYVTGIALVAVFALGEGLSLLRARKLGVGEERAAPARDVALLAGLVPGCVAATLVNPYGWKLLEFPFELTGLRLFMQTIYEWQPPYHVSYNASTMFFFYMIHVGTLSAAFFLAQRDRGRSRAGGESLGVANAAFVAVLAVAWLVLALFWFQNPAVNWRPETIRTFLWLLFGLLSLFTVTNLRTVDFTQAGIFALFYLLSLQHNRAVTDAAMATFPLLASNFSAFLDGPRRAGAAAPARRRSGESPEPPAPIPAAAARPVDRSGAPAILAGSALLVAVSLHASLYTYYFDFAKLRRVNVARNGFLALLDLGTGRERGFGIADNMPTCAVDFIERAGITGNAFVSYAYAAMLIHRMHPAVKVNMDSRNDVYGEDLYREYMGALRSPEGMAAYLERHPIDFFLLSYADRLPAVFTPLESSGAWAPVFYDTKSFILVRRTPEKEEMLRREEFRYLRPSVVASTTLDASNAVPLLEESERAIRNCPASLLGWFYKTKALQVLGRHEESLAVSRHVLEVDPRNAQAYADLGISYAALGQRDRAIESFERAVALDPTFTAARDYLQRLRGF